MPDIVKENERPAEETTSLFSAQTFQSLGGRVVIAGVVATVISGVFSLDPKFIGLLASICVSYAALYLAPKRRRADYVIAGFNGFLIYFTLIGATSFYPYLNKQSASGVSNDQTNRTHSVFSPWMHDPNLVKATQNLMEINREQAKTLSAVEANVAQLEKRVKAAPPSTGSKEDALTGLLQNRNLILLSQTNIASRLATLNKLGVN